MDGGAHTSTHTQIHCESRLENGSHRQTGHSRLRISTCRLKRRLKRRRFESRRDGRPRPSGGAKLRSHCGGPLKITWGRTPLSVQRSEAPLPLWRITKNHVGTDALVRPAERSSAPTVENQQNSRGDRRPVRPAERSSAPTVEDHQKSRRDGSPGPSGGAKLRSHCGGPPRIT